MSDEAKAWTIGSAVAILAILVLILIAMWGMPQYGVWQKGLNGKAILMEAQWEKQAAVEEARAKMESAKLLADAEIERARGVAGANKIIGESLKNNESYLRYLWIQGLNDGSSEVIYVPTEANLPILEATRNIK